MAPQHDDILCFDDGGYGHVAIIKQVDSDKIHIIEQNWHRNTAYARLPWNKATNFVPNRDGYAIQGWLRLDKILIKAEGHDEIYWLQNGKRYHVIDPAILEKDTSMSMWDLQGWGWNELKELPSSSVLFQYPEGPEFIAPDSRSQGLLIRQVNTPEVYEVQANGQLHHVTYEECNNINCWNDIIDVSQAIMNLFPQPSQGSPPTITSIDFPSQIPADGQQYWGQLYFQDPEGDIESADFEIVQGGLDSFTKHPGVQGQTSGSFPFYMSCTTPQQVTYQVTLIDEAGHRSDPYSFSFTCQGQQAQPQLYVHPTDFDFGTLSPGDARSGTFYIENSGGGTLNWSLSVSGQAPSWLSISPVSGSGDATVNFTVNTSGLTGPTTYEAQVEVDSNGGQVYISIKFQIGGSPHNNQPPVAVAHASPTSGPAPLTVHFDSSGSYDPDGRITNLRWDFGDGETSYELNPTHTYSIPGTYQVLLAVRDDNGSGDFDNSIIITVTSVGPPPPPGPSPRGITSHLSQGLNGVFSSVSFQLSELKNYGCGDVGLWNDNRQEWVNEAYVPEFEFYWIYVSNSCTVRLNESTYAGSNWRFPSGGDQWWFITATKSWNEFAGGCYLTAGPWVCRGGYWNGDHWEKNWQKISTSESMDGFQAYWVKVSSSCETLAALSEQFSHGLNLPAKGGNAGVQAPDQPPGGGPEPGKPGEPGKPPPPGPSPGKHAPTASFTFSPASPKVGEIVHFTDQSTDPDNDISSWSWDFGDGFTSTSKDPSHSYSQAGTYTVRLSVRDSQGNSNTINKGITVGEIEAPPPSSEGVVCDYAGPDKKIDGSDLIKAIQDYARGKLGGTDLIKIIQYYASKKECEPSTPPPPQPPSPTTVCRQDFTGKELTVPGRFPTIQQAIDNAKDGDKIVIYPGVYREHVWINKSLILEAKKQEDKPVQIQAGRDKIALTISKAKDVVVRGLTITGSKTGLSIGDSDTVCLEQNNISNNFGSGISVSRTNSIAVHNNIIKGNVGYGVSSNDSSKVEISQNQIADTAPTTGAIHGTGISVSGGDQIKIIGNSPISANRHQGIYVSNATDVQIKDNRITKIPDKPGTEPAIGIRLGSKVLGATISGNSITDTEIAMQIDGSTSINLSNNHISQIKVNGILITNSTRIRLEQNQISQVAPNSVFAGDQAVGIWIGSGSRATLSGNRVSHCFGYGVLIDSSEADLIGGNRITNTDGKPGTPGRGVGVISADATLSGNTISNNEDDGIAVLNGASCGIISNTITGNGGYGILTDSSEVTITCSSPNTMSGNKEGDLSEGVPNSCGGLGGTSLGKPQVGRITAYLTGSLVNFAVAGQGIEDARVQIYDLAGQRIFDSGYEKGQTVEWHLNTDAGHLAANGVYLYAVTVRGYDGREVMSKVGKLVVLR